jgi:hypothetical protein
MLANIPIGSKKSIDKKAKIMIKTQSAVLEKKALTL